MSFGVGGVFVATFVHAQAILPEIPKAGFEVFFGDVESHADGLIPICVGKHCCDGFFEGNGLWDVGKWRRLFCRFLFARVWCFLFWCGLRCVDEAILRDDIFAVRFSAYCLVSSLYAYACQY